MKKKKIILYHLLAFVLGSAGIVVYFLFKMSALSGQAGLAVAIVGPAIALIEIVAFGILTLISMLVFLVISYFFRKK